MQNFRLETYILETFCLQISYKIYNGTGKDSVPLLLSKMAGDFVLWTDLDLDEILGDYTESEPEISDPDTPSESSCRPAATMNLFLHSSHQLINSKHQKVIKFLL